jgi:hypothetical protein
MTLAETLDGSEYYKESARKSNFKLPNRSEAGNIDGRDI